MSQHHRLVVCAALFTTTAAVPRVQGQGACCTPQTCVDAANAQTCASFGGVYLEGAPCAEQPCGPGACCTGLACLDGFDAYGCVSGGRDYAGGGSLCADDPCDIGVGACCLAGVCSVQPPRDCTTAAGQFLGPGSQCLNDPCNDGACCLPGACQAALHFECDALGGVFVPDRDCASSDACAVVDNCPADALASQPHADSAFLSGLISDDNADLKRFDRFVEVPGAIETLTWFGFEVEFTGSGFVGCEDTSHLFLIELLEDTAAGPGAVACSYSFVQATAQATDIFLEGFELQRYDLALDPPCVLTHGWLSIRGVGDDCWLAWANASSGDGFNLCEGCVQPLQSGDTAWCLLGPFGGLQGACCEESSGACADEVDISACTALDQRFVDSSACSALTPPCAPLSGPCCLTDGTCQELGEVACAEAAGDWQGPEASCQDCPVFGACCIDGTNCVFTTAEACLEESLTWLGDDTVCEDCPDPPACDGAALFTQQPDVPPSFFAGTSEASSPFRRWEDVSTVPGAIEGLQWWGIDLEPQGNSWLECIESLDEFEISFHEDGGGTPGTAVCSYVLQADKTVHGLSYGGTELNAYEVLLPEPCVLTDGWVSIVGRGEPSCWFLWLSADSPGASWCGGCPNSVQDSDLSLCLQGQVGGSTGACCHTVSGACRDDVDIAQCLGPDEHFNAGSTCAKLDPPCGLALGACCLPNGLCSTALEQTCVVAGGTWLGAHSVCELCPCNHSCAAAAVAEGEPQCFDGYVDAFNAGCETPEAFFSPIELCQTVCGTSGVTPQGKDYDWYEVQLQQSDTLVWTVDAEFEVVAGIVDGTTGCAALQVLTSGIADPCDPVTLTAEVGPGTYWLVVQPADVGDTPCGSGYTASLAGVASCTVTCQTAADCADRNHDGVRDDGCLWWTCDDGLCVDTAVVYGDVGGPGGDCPPDGAADGNDRFHALSCFANVDNAGNVNAYPCEDDPPRAYNVDTAGMWGQCQPDGICDANDAFASLNAFEGDTPCACPLEGPAPEVAVPLAGRSALRLMPRREQVYASGQVQMEVHLQEPLPDLRGYQLHIGIRGGRSGHLRLVDMAVHRRRDAAWPMGPDWMAFNLTTRQLAAGLDGPGMPAAPGYLATLTLQASADASGVFTVELLQAAQHRPHRTTLLPGASPGRIALGKSRAAAMHVLPHPHAAFNGSSGGIRRERSAPRR